MSCSTQQCASRVVLGACGLQLSKARITMSFTFLGPGRRHILILVDLDRAKVPLVGTSSLDLGCPATTAAASAATTTATTSRDCDLGVRVDRVCFARAAATTAAPARGACAVEVDVRSFMHRGVLSLGGATAAPTAASTAAPTTAPDGCGRR